MKSIGDFFVSKSVKILQILFVLRAFFDFYAQLIIYPEKKKKERETSTVSERNRGHCKNIIYGS